MAEELVQQDTSTEPSACANCDSTLVDSYCAQCGQRQLGGRLSLRRLARDGVSRIVNLEQGLVGTLRELVRNPGGVALAYVDGKRRRYIGPISLLILAVALSMLFFRLVETRLAAEMVEQFETEFQKIAERDENIREALDGGMIETFVGVVVKVIKAAATYTSGLTALFYAFLLRVFFAGHPRRFNLAEHSVLAFYTVALALLIVAPIYWLLAQFGLSVSAAQQIAMPLYLAAAAFGGYGFYGKKADSAIKSGLAMLLALVAFMLLVAFIMAVVVILMMRSVMA